MSHVFILSDYALTYVGGAQTALKRQAQAFAAAGHRVTLFAPDAPDAHGLGSVAPVAVPHLAALPGLGLPVIPATARLQAWFAAMVKARKPDLIIAHSEFGLAATAARVAREAGVPFFHTVHTFFWSAPAAVQWTGPAVKGFHRLLTKLPAPQERLAPGGADSALRGMTLALARAADIVLSPSHHQAEKLRQAGAGRVEQLSNVVETVDFPAPFPPLPSPGTGRPLELAWVGRFAPEKRLEVARAGIARARGAGGIPVNLRIAGGEAPADQAAGEEFLGTLTASGVAELLDRSHALVLSSVGFDNQPMVILEAAARGRPTIVLDPVLGHEFGPAVIPTPGPSAQDLAETVQTLLAEPTMLTTASAAARAYAAGASGTAHVARILALAAEVRRTST